MLNVPVVMLVAAVAVLVGVVAVAVGRGGELTFFQGDYAPLKLDEISATDVVLFRPPMALWGYSVQATDEALNRIAEALTERDIEITALRQQVADLEAWPPGSPRARGVPGSNDRADVPGRPASGWPAASPDERSPGPLPPAGPPPGASGPGTRSPGPLPQVGPPPGASGPGTRSPGPLPQVGPPPGASGPGTRSSGPLPRVGPPPGAAGLSTRDARTTEVGSDRAARPAASGARDAERFSLGGTAPPGHHPPPAGADQPPAPGDGEDER
jgi:hypothetical protein